MFIVTLKVENLNSSKGTGEVSVLLDTPDISPDALRPAAECLCVLICSKEFYQNKKVDI